MTIEAGAATGLKSSDTATARRRCLRGVGGVVGALEAAGFRPVRLLAEREGYKFAEGIKHKPASGGQPDRSDEDTGSGSRFRHYPA